MSKYYAVKQGHKTGVFESWEECKEQVHRFKGAQYKSFSTENEALNYLNQSSKTQETKTKETKKVKNNQNVPGNSPESTKFPTKIKPNFYAVKIGRKTGIFQSWDECKDQVYQFKGAQYKSFVHEHEALEYLDQGKKENKKVEKKKKTIQKQSQAYCGPKVWVKNKKPMVIDIANEEDESDQDDSSEEEKRGVIIIDSISSEEEEEGVVEEDNTIFQHFSGYSCKFHWDQGMYVGEAIHGDYRITFFHKKSKTTISIYLMIKDILSMMNKKYVTCSIREKIQSNIYNLFDNNDKLQILAKVNGIIRVDFEKMKKWLRNLLL